MTKDDAPLVGKVAIGPALLDPMQAMLYFRPGGAQQYHRHRGSSTVCVTTRRHPFDILPKRPQLWRSVDEKERTVNAGPNPSSLTLVHEIHTVRVCCTGAENMRWSAGTANEPSSARAWSISEAF